MTDKKVIEMIDSYMLIDTNSIDKEWFMCLLHCRQAIVDKNKLTAKVESLEKHNDYLLGEVLKLKNILGLQ